MGLLRSDWMVGWLILNPLMRIIAEYTVIEGLGWKMWVTEACPGRVYHPLWTLSSLSVSYWSWVEQFFFPKPFHHAVFALEPAKPWTESSEAMSRNKLLLL